MKIMIQLNGELYSPLSYSVNRQLPEIGELRPNRASVSLDNTQNDFKFNPSTNKIIDKNNNVVDKDIKIIIYDYETSKIFFTGYTDIPEINFKNKTLEINAHDSITYLQEQIAEEKLYLDFQLDDIILDILDGYDIASEFADISLVIDNYRIEKDTTKADALKTLLTDVGGLLYTNEKNEIVFDGGYIKALQNPPKTPIDNLYKTHVKSYDTTLPDNSYDKIIITSESLKKKDKLKYIYINADYEKPESDITKVNFDNPIWYLDDYSNIEFKSDDGVIFDETTYNSNFLSGNTPKNADSITVDYGFNTGKIDYLKIKGKEFETNTFEGVAGADLLTNKTKTIKCSLIQSSTWASDLANYYYRELHNRPQSRVILADFERFFDLEYNLNKYVNIFFVDEGISNKMQITAYKINVSSRKFDIELSLRYSSGDSFVPSPLTITESNNNQGLDLDEIDAQVELNTNNITNILSDLSDIASDNKLTPDEKKQLQKLYNTITNEKIIVENTADYYSIDKTNYINAYNTLINYLDTLNIFTLVTVSINRNTFNNNFTNYYNEKTKIYKELSNLSNSRIGLTEQELNDIAADGKLTAVEKLQFQPTFEAIKKEYTSIIANASAYGISSTNYTNTYNTIVNYIDSINLYNNETTDIDRITFNSNFEEYYNQREELLKNISVAAEIRIEGVEAAVGTIADDSKITPIEKRTLRVAQYNIQDEYADIINTANLYGVSTTTFTNAYNDLNTYLNGLNLDSNTTETVVRTTFNSKFDTYFNSRKDILQTIENESKGLIDANKNKLDEFSTDNKLTPPEKKSVNTMWEDIKEEYVQIVNSANTYSVSTTTLTNLYNTLSSYITPLLSNLNITSDINRETFKANFTNYYDERATVVNNINTVSEGRIEGAEQQLSDFSSDGKLTPPEKKAVNTIFENLTKEYYQLLNTAGLYSISTSTITAQYNALENYLTPLLSNLNTTSDIDREQFNARFAFYYSARSNLLQSIDEEAENRIDASLQQLTDIAADSKLTPNEKLAVKKEWERIQNEFPYTLSTATDYGIDSNSYQFAYHELDTYITPLLSNLTTTDNIDRSIFNLKFVNYYRELQRIVEDTDIKVNQNMTNKKLYQGTTFELGKGALPDGSDGLYIDSGQLLIGQSKTADKRLYYDGNNLEIVGGTLKLSSTEGEIEFLDSSIKIFDGKGYGDDSIYFRRDHIDNYYTECQYIFDVHTYSQIVRIVKDGVSSGRLYQGTDGTRTTIRQTYEGNAVEIHMNAEELGTYYHPELTLTTFNSSNSQSSELSVFSDKIEFKVTNDSELSIFSDKIEFKVTDNAGTGSTSILSSCVVLPFSTTSSGKPEGSIWYDPDNDSVYVRRGNETRRLQFV